MLLTNSCQTGNCRIVKYSQKQLLALLVHQTKVMLCQLQLAVVAQLQAQACTVLRTSSTVSCRTSACVLLFLTSTDEPRLCSTPADLLMLDATCILLDKNWSIRTRSQNFGFPQQQASHTVYTAGATDQPICLEVNAACCVCQTLRLPGECTRGSCQLLVI